MNKNDLYYNMCDKYTLYVQWGRKGLKEDYERALKNYEDAGGKKKVKII